MKVKQTKYMHLSGLEPLVLNENSNFINVGERQMLQVQESFYA